jgi:hypothetical protein
MRMPVALLVLGLTAAGCSSLDDTHRALLLERITNQGERAATAYELAALGKRPERQAELLADAAFERSSSAALRSDVAANLR